MRIVSGPAKYQALHGKLVKHFEWQRSDAPAEHAEETINRVARQRPVQGSYVVLLSGAGADDAPAESLGGYSFTVTRK